MNSNKISIASVGFIICLLMQSDITPIVPLTFTPEAFTAILPFFSFISKKSASSWMASSMEAASPSCILYVFEKAKVEV